MVLHLFAYLLTALFRPGFHPFSHLVDQTLTKMVSIQLPRRFGRLLPNLLMAKMYHPWMRMVIKDTNRLRQWMHMVTKDTNRLHQWMHMVTKDTNRLHQWLHTVILSRKGEGEDRGLGFLSNFCVVISILDLFYLNNKMLTESKLENVVFRFDAFRRKINQKEDASKSNSGIVGDTDLKAEGCGLIRKRKSGLFDVAIVERRFLPNGVVLDGVSLLSRVISRES